MLFLLMARTLDVKIQQKTRAETEKNKVVVLLDDVT